MECVERGVDGCDADRAFFESALASAGMGPFRDISERERRVSMAGLPVAARIIGPRHSAVA
ncbi:hypothetical protein GCM10011579_089900 [Streptomyces albiflavescens]|uniref:Uncharacterized protein n=1 Tax=Streptomyces albiflavescens TaxID=1623582 RepID=A0A917YDP7_9ACTN|nr:hypothetical protein GCM10011579_089900 [Streptomyces albiflavescens]